MQAQFNFSLDCGSSEGESASSFFVS